MRAKTKILVSVLALILCISALGVGVWAAITNAQVGINGSVSFETNSVTVDVYGYVEGSTQSINPYKFKHYNGSYNISENLPNWNYGTVGFTNKDEPITFVFEVSNYSVTDIRVGIEVTTEDVYDIKFTEAPAYISASDGTTATTGKATLALNLDLDEYQTLGSLGLNFRVVINEYTGSGSSKFNPIRISTATEWGTIENNKFYELKNNITVTSQKSITNTYIDGLGYTITNNQNMALLTSISGKSTIKNLNIKSGSTVNTFSGNNMGVLANSIAGTNASNNVVIENVNITGSAISNTSRSTTAYVGAFAGVASYADFIRCENDLAITVTGTSSYSLYVGGIVGSANSSNKFIKCENNGSLTVNNSTGNIYVGGILSYSSSAQTFYRCYNFGAITTNHTDSTSTSTSDRYNFIGGIIGRMAYGTMQYCGNEGTISMTTTSISASVVGTAGNHVGGLIGSLNGNSSTQILYNYNKADVTGRNNTTDGGTISVGGIIGLSFTFGQKIYNNYNIGQITSGGYLGNRYAGGIIGMANTKGNSTSYQQYVWGNYNLGRTITQPGDSYEGTAFGIIGYARYYVSIKANYNAGSTGGSGSTYVAGGIAKIYSSTQNSTTYVTGNYFVSSSTYGLYYSTTGSNTGCTTMAVANMKLNSFATTMNTACTSAGLSGTIFVQNDAYQNGYPYFYELGAEKTGSEEDPIYISSVEDWDKYIASSNYATSSSYGYFKQTNDIIGNFTQRTTSFYGSYDGAGYTIKDENNKSLFSALNENAQIKNLNIISNITSSNHGSYIGMLAEQVANTGVIIENVNTYGSITTSVDDVGGLVGYVYNNAKINNCSNYATITATTATTSHIGGLIGYVYTSSSTDGGFAVNGCANYGDINLTGTGSYTRYVGGIIGSSKSVTQVSNSFADCDITVDTPGTEYIGGIVGYISSTSSSDARDIKNCYFKGTLSSTNSTGSKYITGIGYNNADGVISNCYFAGTMSKQSAADSLNAIGLSSKSVTNCFYDSSKQSGLLTATGVTATTLGYFTGTTANPSYVWYALNGNSSTGVWSAGGTTYINEGYPYLASNQTVVKGLGTSASPYEVNGVGSYVKAMSKATASAVYINQTSDITGVMPQVSSFSGQYNGGEHTIYNNNNEALINILNDGCSITDLSIKADVTKATSNYAGILANQITDTNQNTTSLVNVKTYGTLTGSATRAGGLVGYANTSIKFDKCVNNADVSSTSNSSYVGGVLGFLETKAGVIDSCINYGNISGRYAFGVCAFNVANSYVINSSNNGNIKGSYIAGIAVLIGSDYALNNYNTGTLTGTHARGIAISSAASNTIINNYNVGELISNNSYGITDSGVPTTLNYVLEGTATTNTLATVKTEAEFKAIAGTTGAVVDLLNSNISSLSTTHSYYNWKVGNLNKGYPYHKTTYDGTAEDPYPIASQADWNKYVVANDGSAGADKYFVQTASFTLGSSGLTSFQGHYDGGGYTITTTGPIFNTLTGGTFKNLKIQSNEYTKDVTDGILYLGALAAQVNVASGNTLIIDGVNVSGTVGGAT